MSLNPFRSAIGKIPYPPTGICCHLATSGWKRLREWAAPAHQRFSGYATTRIPMIPTDMPFEFKRLRFPVRLDFAMSINKAQEQSLKGAGINLSTSWFSHGQLTWRVRESEPERIYVFLLLTRKRRMLSLKPLCDKESISSFCFFE